LREQQEFFRNVIDTVPNFIGIKNWDGEFVLANRALAEAYGTTPQDIIGKTDADFNPNKEEVEWFRRDDQEVIKSRKPKFIPAEKVTDSQGRVRWLSTIKVPLIEENGTSTRVLLATHDITELKEAEEEREVFIHTISHDLRSPLSVVKGHVDLVQELVVAAGIDSQLLDSLQAIQRGVQRITAMTADMVDSARWKAGQLQLKTEPIDLPSYIMDYLERAQPIMDVERISLDIKAGLPLILADANRLERILVNLLSNALKYSPPERSVILRARLHDSEVVVSVQDFGQGIPPEDIPRLFDRFFRAKGGGAVEGIGLGLYIAKLLVEAHGGRIWVDTELEKGSTFSFTLLLYHR